MKVQIGKTKYDVKYKRMWVDLVGDAIYITGPESLNAAEDKTMVTDCIISTINAKRKGRAKYTEVCTGYAQQSIGDAPNKFIGRKVSFTKALNQGHFSKAERTKFWDAFKKEQGIEKNVKAAVYSAIKVVDNYLESLGVAKRVRDRFWQKCS
jgi:hypothetical protein